jgi:hypothetical protein
MNYRAIFFLLISTGSFLYGMDSEMDNENCEASVKQLCGNTWVHLLGQSESIDTMHLTSFFEVGKEINFVFNVEDLLLLYKYQVLSSVWKYSRTGGFYSSSQVAPKDAQEFRENMHKRIQDWHDGKELRERLELIHPESPTQQDKIEQAQTEREMKDIELTARISEKPLRIIDLDNRQTESSPLLKNIIFPKMFDSKPLFSQDACIEVAGLTEEQLRGITIKAVDQDIPFANIGSLKLVEDEKKGVLKLADVIKRCLENK